MEWSPTERLQFKNQVERILHIQGNYTGGILEMALVLDYDMPLTSLRERSAAIIKALKMHSEVFRNVRLNVIKWVSDDCLIKEVSAFAMVQMGRIFEDYDLLKKNGNEPKKLDVLASQLQMFYARSKLILVLTNGNYCLEDKEAVCKFMQPFLHKKLLILQPEGIIPGTRLLLQSDS